MANTTNFGWETPDDTDLVKDGAAAMRTLGNAIDTSFVDLKGGTTGQVLSKASNTDLDYTWVTTDDANAIQNAIVDAKGDLIAASANDTPARLAVGSNGDTLLADSSTTTGLRWQPQFLAGKNKIINGDFGIWQRGTTWTDPAFGTYTADRFYVGSDGTGSKTFTRQSFTAGTAPVAGYESQYFYRVNQTTAGSGGTYNIFGQKIEDVRTFANQTVTLSFWAKSAGTSAISATIRQDFGSGGSSSVDTAIVASTATTTGWVRYSGTVAVPSISGKTIGTGSSITVIITVPVNATFTLDFWGFQLESGSVATPFQTATGTLAGELAACQRYYWRNTGNNYSRFTQFTPAQSATLVYTQLQNPVQMRVKPTSIDFANLAWWDNTSIGNAVTALTINGDSNVLNSFLTVTTTGMTQYRNYQLMANNTDGYIGLSAEL